MWTWNTLTSWSLWLHEPKSLNVSLLHDLGKSPREVCMFRTILSWKFQSRYFVILLLENICDHPYIAPQYLIECRETHSMANDKDIVIYDISKSVELYTICMSRSNSAIPYPLTLSSSALCGHKQESLKSSSQ